MKNNNTDILIDTIKREFIKNYFYLLSFILLINIIIYYIFEHTFLIYYLLGGFLLLLYTLLFFPKYYNINRLVSLWFIIGPLYVSLFIIVLSNYSRVALIWLFPLPLAAYMFFSFRTTTLYTIYTFVYLALLSVISYYTDFYKNIYIPNQGITYIDFTAIINYFLLMILILYYKNKINRAKYQIQNKNEIEHLMNVRKEYLQSQFSQEELNKYSDLFSKISEYMENKKPYKKADFTISELSSLLNSNSTYISRAIRINGFSNFNNFLNSYRINYVKKSLEENEHNHFTLNYIYTEAGFTHQSTFNRSFKESTGQTPSQYISDLKKKEQNIST